MADRDAQNGAEIAVEVCCARPERQVSVVVRVPRGTRVRRIVELSRIADAFPEVDLQACQLGVFGRVVDDGFAPGPGDRVEIYRPLRLDPRAARRERARLD